jgi:hypothetical protein
MLPAELQRHERLLEGLGEPPLWSANAVEGRSRRIRLLLVPPRITRVRVAIRIDTTVSGRAVGHWVRRERRHGRWTTQKRRFSVRREDLARLDVLIAQSRLWRLYPEYWESEDICVDGVQLIMERATAEGYRFSEANAQCTAPRDYLEVAAQMIDMAGLGRTDAATCLE